MTGALCTSLSRTVSPLGRVWWVVVMYILIFATVRGIVA